MENDDFICPFIQKECLYTSCALWQEDGNMSGCSFSATATRMKSVESELQQIKRDISSLNLKID